ncbi:Signal transduction histidine kinase [Variovorax sp. PAMC 28711]|uniref:Signal transduction histidine kinase n=1 Tax=Variovorax sp. PAMC 28711 TaxID=1795631 RepID=UPI00078E9417|nr:Signal transduction histidine kinase [Variovorax sp. PAMC 28711]AMM26115.1 Signal transduction histidine kinase [Variovorax sp. PAMC 28711]
MGWRLGLLSLVVVLIVALATLNWGALVTPVDMWIGFMTVSAPLGLIMLGLTALLGLMFLFYVFYLQSTVMIDARRHSKEMQVQRELADKAEASRFTELRNFIEAQAQKQAARATDMQQAVLVRVDQVDNTIAAHIGQLEDRLERRAMAVTAPQPAVTPSPFA